MCERECVCKRERERGVLAVKRVESLKSLFFSCLKRASVTVFVVVCVFVCDRERGSVCVCVCV